MKEKKKSLDRSSGGNVLKVIMIVLYVIVGIIGVLGLLERFVDIRILSPVLAGIAYKGNIWAGQALAIMVGLMFISYLPTVLYFVSFNFENNLQKKGRILSFVIGVVLSAAFCAIALLLYDRWNLKYTINTVDGSAGEQVLTIIVSHVGLLIMYLFNFVNLDADAIEQRASEKENRASGIMAIFVEIFNFIGKICGKILAFFIRLRKTPILYYPIITILFTVLCFFVAFIALVLVAVLIINTILMYFTGVIRWAYQPSPRYVYKVNEGGYERTLKPVDGYTDRYIDDLGRYWRTDDSGETFYRD